eukprot:TRINITY_DN44311_c0_g2_i2.p1 TRINITY_DN44311_c0_g2~~TRINITY_DN44311_c0_g2_i2.p1  ORF type:complete len:410 (-),score=111.69 TRINITY_DN44311_c0_g2_i2:67-1296(-)
MPSSSIRSRTLRTPDTPPQPAPRYTPPTSSNAMRQKYRLLAIVAVDLFAVALVVPLLPQAFKSLGGDAAGWGLFSSVYSVSQVAGGVVLGGFSDRYGRSAGLQLSMVAAGISYGIVGFASSITMLLVSRVIVGLFKQTMTLATALTADVTSTEERASAMARLSAAVSVGWMSGQAAGGTLAEYACSGRSFSSAEAECSAAQHLPAVLSVVLFLLDLLAVRLLLPQGVVATVPTTEDGNPRTHTAGGLTEKLKQIGGLLVTSRELLVVTGLQLGVMAVQRAAKAMEAFVLADRFGLTIGQLGRLGGLQGVVVLAVQASGVAILVKRFGEQRVLACALLASAAVSAIESLDISVQAWSLVVMPASTLLSACLLYTSDAADEEDSVDLGGRRIIKKKKKTRKERDTSTTAAS